MKRKHKAIRARNFMLLLGLLTLGCSGVAGVAALLNSVQVSLWFLEASALMGKASITAIARLTCILVCSLVED